MSNIAGLILLVIIFAGMAALFWYTRSSDKLEINESFAMERGWDFKDVLPQFGQAQRKRILKTDTPFSWEVEISLQQSTNDVSIPVTSTIWRTDEIHLDEGMIVIGPKLTGGMEDIDLSSPLVSTFFRIFRGDLANEIGNLKPVDMPYNGNLTILATDPDRASAVLDDGVLEEYRLWLTRYDKEETFPVMLLSQDWLQFKVRKALKKADEVDQFVDFSIRAAQKIQTVSAQ
jgi:hypothetical protein